MSEVFTMKLVFALVLLLGYPVAAVGQGPVPVLNVEPGCRQGVASGADRRMTFENCMDDEKSARRELEAGWSRFAVNDRERCVALTQTGGNPSYVEVLECLKMAQDVRELERKQRSQ